ncbi:hypothetical protein JW964_06460, partial [candidate division KSB1 bacterium]|nr:hypothetical protein [candidate division KSB1 bacterium]
FGISLLKEQIAPAARFIENHLLGNNGIKMTPEWDVNHTSEPAMSGWYPHWDFPALKLLCRAQKWPAIQKWLNLVEECYTNLGYCPEFLSTQYQSPEIWQHHGAAWNLNCAAGWYNALLDAVVGISFDPGGISCHSTGDNSIFNLKNLNFRKGQWDVIKSGEGEFISFLEVDGEKILGALKILSRFYTSGQHTLKIHYQPAPVETPVLTELTGAELIDIQITKTSIQYTIQGLGTTDVTFSSMEKPVIFLDDKPVPFEWSETLKTGTFQLLLSGKHLFTIHRKGS